MKVESRRMAGILLVVYPSVISGGMFLLSQLMGSSHGYVDNALRQDLFRAGHAHAGVLLLLSLVILNYVDEAELPEAIKGFVRLAAPLAAIFLPCAFFFSVLMPSASRPNEWAYLAFVGAAVLAAGLFILGIGLLRRSAAARGK